MWILPWALLRRLHLPPELTPPPSLEEPVPWKVLVVGLATTKTPLAVGLAALSPVVRMSEMATMSPVTKPWLLEVYRTGADWLMLAMSPPIGSLIGLPKPSRGLSTGLYF